MKSQRIEDAVNNYINGNLSDVKTALKRMRKADVLRFVQCLEDVEPGRRNEQTERVVRLLEW